MSDVHREDLAVTEEMEKLIRRNIELELEVLELQMLIKKNARSVLAANDIMQAARPVILNMMILEDAAKEYQ